MRSLFVRETWIMTTRSPIPDLAALIEQTARRPGTGVRLTAAEVQTALSILRSHLDWTANTATDQLYRVESVGPDGSAAELAVVADPVIARAAYEAAERVAGGKLILRCGAEEISSPPAKTSAA
jgi:hypothetical protein